MRLVSCRCHIASLCQARIVKTRSLNPLAFALRKIAEKMAIVNAAFGHELVIYHFLVHVGKKHFLFVKKCLERLCVHFSAASLRIPHCLELIANSLFEDLEAVLSELVV